MTSFLDFFLVTAVRRNGGDTPHGFDIKGRTVREIVYPGGRQYTLGSGTANDMDFCAGTVCLDSLYSVDMAQRARRASKGGRCRRRGIIDSRCV